METHVAKSAACAGAKGSAALAEFALKYHEREWLRPFLYKAKSTLKACSISRCPCKAEGAAGKKRKESR